MKLIRRALLVALPALIAALFYWHAFFDDRVLARSISADGTRQATTLLSRTHTLDRIYMSMQGPYSNQVNLQLQKSSKSPERSLVWLTGIRAELVGRDGETPISREFFCHSNLTLNIDHAIPQRRRTDSEFTPTQDWRLFTLVPGRLSISLPDGFGVPVYSDESLDYLSMSLNMNRKTGSHDVRFKTTIESKRHDASRPMTALFRRAVYGYEPIGVASPHTMCTSTATNEPGAACGPFVGQAASNSFVASLGTTNTIHWMIPPGHYESRVPIDAQLDLPFDTTAHYITAHLHPYGKSVSLFDATTGETVCEIRSRDFTDRLGVEQMSEVSTTAGVPLHKGHRYELVTTYHNPTSEPIDAMSILYLYCRDKQFDAVTVRQTPD